MQLYAREKGSGQPLILLHGNGEDSTYFEKQMEYFSKKYRVFALDTRGHGRSPRGQGRFALERFAEDLRCFLDQKRLRRVILLGFSDGGNIALIFALRYPAYVDRLILNGANLNPFGMKVPVLLEVAGEYGAACFREAVSGRRQKRNSACRKTASSCAGKASEKELLGLMLREPWIRPQLLRRLKMPVLVVAGTDDMIRERHTRKMAGQFPGGRLKILEGNHFIAAERPAAFNRCVEEFLQATRGTELMQMRRLWGNRRPERLDGKQIRRFAVLVPLIWKRGEYHVLFEVRAGKLRHQPGEVCVPGGAMEAGETARQAAVRETAEELCISRRQVEVIAPLDVLVAPAGLNVYPYLGILKNYRGSFSPEEVARVFTVPLRWFAEHEPECYRTDVITVPGEDFPYEAIPGGRDYHWRRGEYDVMFYRAGDEIIWGMTAKILHSLALLYRTQILGQKAFDEEERR